MRGEAKVWYQWVHSSWNSISDFEQAFKERYVSSLKMLLLKEQALTVRQAANEDPSAFITKKMEQLTMFYPDYTYAQKFAHILDLLYPYYRDRLQQYYSNIVDIPALLKAVHKITEIKNDYAIYESPLTINRQTGALTKTGPRTVPKDLVAQDLLRLSGGEIPAYLPKKQYTAKLKYDANKTRTASPKKQVRYATDRVRTSKDKDIAHRFAKVAPKVSSYKDKSPKEKESKKSDYKKSAKTVTCFNCGKTGHFSPECPEAKKKQNPKDLVHMLEMMYMDKHCSEETEQSDCESSEESEDATAYFLAEDTAASSDSDDDVTVGCDVFSEN